MASQNPQGGNPSMPPPSYAQPGIPISRSSPAPPIGAMQSLNIGSSRPPPPPWASSHQFPPSRPSASMAMAMAPPAPPSSYSTPIPSMPMAAPAPATAHPAFFARPAANGPLVAPSQTPAFPHVPPPRIPPPPPAAAGVASAAGRPFPPPPRPPFAVGPPPQSQPGIASSQVGYGSSAPPAFQGQPPSTWPGSYPPVPGSTPAFQPTIAPGISTQTTPPLPPPPMSQFSGSMASVPGYPQSATGPSVGGSSRIDPSQIPRPQISNATIQYETRVNNQIPSPPSATTNFIAKDMGNCSPRYMRCTLTQIPCSADLLSTSGMPLALLVQPLALPHPSEEPIQVVDFGEGGPVRCFRCKAYINPFMKFVDQGRHFVCSLCGHSNETPRDYHCNLGPDGRRRDADERPELCRGTIEFVATKEYTIRPPMAALFFFLIDVSQNAVQTGATASACSAIQRALADLPEGLNTKVGIATYDTTLHFYNLNRSLQQPSMLVVPDIQDVYTPLQTGLIVSLSECRQHLEQLLESIPSMFQHSRTPDSAFGAAIKGAFLAMKSTGGKLLVFQSALPSVGFGALTAREAEGKIGSASGEKEINKLLQPADKTLKSLAFEFAEFQVCVDLFLTTQTYVDIASLAVVPRTTGGQAYYYHPFNAAADSAKLYNDLRWNLTRPQGLEAVMRVRCSQGLQVQEYFGNYCKRIPTDVDLAAIDCDKTIMVTFKHDEKFQEGSECCFQCALLYTNLYGERRIRVTTLSLPCTSVLSTVFRGADLDAQFTYLLKQAAQEVPATPLVQVREQMTNFCVNILHAYRKFCAVSSSSGQLILPEALKLLPLYTLALTKGVGLRPDTRIDERSYWLARAASISASLAIPLVYPRMFSIHDLAAKDLGEAELPLPLALSSEHLDNEGIFLLENGEDAFVYTGKSASPEILHQLFGVRSVNEMVSSEFLLQEYDNDASRKLNHMVNEIRRHRCSYLRLRWCKRGDPLEFTFFSLMVEDKNSLGMSYVEFLVHVHRQIQNKMT